MNYEKIYQSLIQKRQKYTLTKNKNDSTYIYCETHHIIPVCMNGSNEKANLINLTAREHYIAHLLLRRIYPNNIKLSLAVELMQVYSKLNIRKFRFNSKLFQQVRKQNSQLRSNYQSSLRWIRNVRLNLSSYWPKDENLTLQMINDGWEFGRLYFDCHSNRTYENNGYEAGKYIRITNDIKDMYILKTSTIPNGYHRGMSKQNRLNQSKGCVGRNGTTTGKIVIHNPQTLEIRFVNPKNIPDGWAVGRIRTKPKRIFTNDEDNYIMTHFISWSVKYCCTTAKIIQRRIKELKQIYPDFVPLKASHGGKDKYIEVVTKPAIK